jgi:Ca2+/Na+ antiporter
VKRAVALLPALAAIAVLVVVCALRADDLAQALDRVQAWVFAAACGLHLLVVAVRAEAWRSTLAAIGRTPSRAAAHWASAIGFMAGIVEGHAALPTRMTVARQIAPDATPPLREMVLSDLPVYAIEGCLIAALVPLAAVAQGGLPVWALALLVVGAPAALVALRLLHQRFASHPLAAGLAVLADTGLRRRLLVLAAAVVGLTFARIWIVLAAVGLPAAPADAALAYIAVTAVGQLPLGPAAGPAATLAVASGAGVAAAAAAGLVVSASSCAGVLAYLACTATVRPRGASRRPFTSIARTRTR